jgi:hypothetical protein
MGIRHPLVTAVVLLLLVTLVSIFYRPSKVTRASFEKIEAGMTLAEVEAILGGPEGDYRTSPTELTEEGIRVQSQMGGSLWDGPWLYWEGNAGAGAVNVTHSGIVLRKGWIEKEKENVGIVEVMYWRFTRWRKWAWDREGRMPSKQFVESIRENTTSGTSANVVAISSGVPYTFGGTSAGAALNPSTVHSAGSGPADLLAGAPASQAALDWIFASPFDTIRSLKRGETITTFS